MRNLLTAFFCTLLLGFGLTADAQRLIVTDSGGVEREVKRLIVTDSGSVEREIKRLFVVDSGGTARLVFLGTTVTLTGGTFGAGEEGTTDTSRFQLTVDADGNTYGQENTDPRVQINSATDWIDPESEAPGAYQVRYTNHVGDALAASSSAAENAWHALSVGDYFLVLEQSGLGSKSATFDLQIREGTGPVIAAAEYTLTADVLF